ncbi:ANTAR domain-containing response regulator [Facklamia lactis]|uniref:ANTAR domain-containing response regulator n=1 Tax=Facklamia lactis TaxID=2749967 RepID=UPI0018CD72C8|nr:response regulator [Facklamia lactis]MBG9979475.1 response regulator [Facklamia lactis]
MKSRILIVDDEKITRMDLKEILINSGYDVVGEAKDGFEAITSSSRLKPDLVIMDIKMPGLDGLSAAKRILHNETAASIVLLTAYSDMEFINVAKEIGALGYVVKPIDERSLIPTIELAIENGKNHKLLADEIESISTKLKDRIIIDRAKGYLMTRDHLTEEEAYKELRKISMDKRVSMAVIAEMLVGE